MGIFDWLLTDPSQADGGFLAALLHGGKLSGESDASPLPASPDPASSSLLGESPLINMLRSGFAGMNAANGYSGFAPQFAAGLSGGANAMAQRRGQLMEDRLNRLAYERAAPANSGQPSAGGSTDQNPASPCAGNCAGRNSPVGIAQSGKPGSGSGDPGSAPDAPIKVNSPEEAANLPSGTWFQAPDGRVLRGGTAAGS